MSNYDCREIVDWIYWKNVEALESAYQIYMAHDVLKDDALALSKGD